MLLVLQFSSVFRAACSPNSLVPFEQFLPALKFSSLFRAVDPCSQILYSLSSGLLLVLKVSSPFRAVCALFSNFLVSFEWWFAPCYQNLYSLSSGLLPALKIPNPFRTVCALLLDFLVSCKRFAPCSQFLHSPSSGCSPFSNSLVSFERFAPCSPIL